VYSSVFELVSAIIGRLPFRGRVARNIPRTVREPLAAIATAASKPIAATAASKPIAANAAQLLHMCVGVYGCVWVWVGVGVGGCVCVGCVCGGCVGVCVA
jgi:hypothetical protein